MLEPLSIFPLDNRRSELIPMNPLLLNTFPQARNLIEDIVSVFNRKKGGRVRGDIPLPITEMARMPTTTFDSPVGPILGAVASSVLPVVASFLFKKLFEEKKGIEELDGDDIEEIIEEVQESVAQEKITKDAQSILNRVIGRGIIEIN